MLYRISLLLALAATVVGPAAAQDYQVGAGDTLSVQVFDEPQLSHSAVVPSSCDLNLDLIGAVHICGRTTTEIAADIQARYANGFLVSPHIIVEVTTYGSQKIEVRGSIKTPGIQVLTGPTSLSQAITAAGGPDGTNVVDVEVDSADGKQSTYQLSTLNLTEPPVLVSGGDTVILRQGRQVYVDGEVKNQGSVAYREGITVSQVVTLAGGPTEYATLRRVFVLRSTGAKLVVNLVRVRNGKDQDVVLGPDDRVTLRRSYF